jgi:phospholipase/carboxylesterase
MRQEVNQGSTLEYLTVYPQGHQDQASYPLLIWLHGFGADMHDLAGLAGEVNRTGYLHVLPNAPLGGFGGPEGTVRAWFERGGKETPESVRLALAGLGAFVQEVLERFRVPARKALLVGFSQGGNLALRFGLPRPDLFSGLAALSCSLRQADDLLPDLPVERSLPLFLAHGLADSMVPAEYSRGVVKLLLEQGYQPIYQEHQMGHEINEALLAELKSWITRTLPPSEPGQIA